MSFSSTQININPQALKSSASSVINNMANPKALIGLVLTLFGLYQMYSAVPEAWDRLNTSSAKVNELEENKKMVAERLKQLQLTDKTLGEPSISIYQLLPSQTPQLATLDLAQKVVKLSDDTGNKLISLTPRNMRTVNFDKVVDIQIQIDPPPAAEATTETTNTATPIAPTTNSTPVAAQQNAQTAIQCSEYQMVVSGSVQSIVQFLYRLMDLKTALFIEKITINTDASGIVQSGIPTSSTAAIPLTTSSSAPKLSDLKLPAEATSKGLPPVKETVAQPLKPVVAAKGNLTLDFTFLIPWKPVGSA